MSGAEDGMAGQAADEKAGAAAGSRRLAPEVLTELVQARSVESLSGPELLRLFQAEEATAEFLPDGVHQVDPRDGAVVTFNAARSRRPHDTAVWVPDEVDGPCPICQGRTTGVVDLAPLREGFTFINKNLFPILRRPEATAPSALVHPAGEEEPSAGHVAHGLHFLQWTSSVHDHDWHNLGHDDRSIVLGRLAALERTLLYGAEGLMPTSEPRGRRRTTYGYVSIIKNYGRQVGGSLSHGHQQIAFSNIMPRRFFNNLQFAEQNEQAFSAFMLDATPAELAVRDYGSAVLVVPYFMRRPYDMLLLVRDTRRQFLSDLEAEELAAVADGWHDATRAILTVMPRLGRPPAYNITVNNGPGAGLYVEFLPFTQETGGFEHLGLWVCQDSPQNVAARLREILAAKDDDHSGAA